MCSGRRVNREGCGSVGNRGSGEREKMRFKTDFLPKGLANWKRQNVELVDEGHLAELPWGRLKYQTVSGK